MITFLMENGKVMLVRRDTKEKILMDADEVAAAIPGILEDIQNGLFKRTKRKGNLYFLQAAGEAYGGFRPGVLSRRSSALDCSSKIVQPLL